MTKIDVISGFLGAGKTTLIKKLISEALSGEKVVLIENEFGEIGIDGGFMKDAGIEITELNSGCICCSLVGDFGEALKQVINEFHPDRIIIEPSGVGKLSDVMGAVKKTAEECSLELNSATTVADAKKCRIYMKNFGEFYDNQIENAGAIILSRTQLVSEEKLEEAVRMLREKNGEARILTTPWDELSGARIMEVIEESEDLTLELMKEAAERAIREYEEEEAEEDDDDGDEHHHHHHHHHDHDEDHDHDEHEHHHDDDDDDDEHEHHHDDDDDDDHDEHEHHHHHHDHHGHHHHHHHGHDADEIFTSWGLETPKKFDREVLENALKVLSESEDFGAILRAKGMVALTDGTWGYFDLVPGEYEIREGAPDYTGRLCVIGSELKEEKLGELFGV
ncbi:MAG: GTP-binding protein [Lachnospiraceae bacterium]|nr:GTP-binding protein [Lachnospiraceae bacterium]